MTVRLARRAGVSLLALFLLLSAVRDVFFSWVFQGMDIFAVAAVIFGTTAIVFGCLTLPERSRWRGSLRHARAIFAVNVLTATAWLAYLWAVKLMEPAIANTIWSGVGPLTVAGLTWYGASNRGRWPSVPVEDIAGREKLAYLGVLATVTYLAVAALAGRSGISTADPRRTLTGIVLAAGSGVAIALAIVVTKRLHDANFSARQVVAMRFCLLVGVASIAAVTGLGATDGHTNIGLQGAAVVSQRFTSAAHLIPAGLLLIAIPIYALQAAVVRLQPLTIEAVAALGPPVVFTMQAFDGRLHFSSFTAVGIVGYSICTAAVAAARLTSRSPSGRDAVPRASTRGP